MDSKNRLKMRCVKEEFDAMYKRIRLLKNLDAVVNQEVFQKISKKPRNQSAFWRQINGRDLFLRSKWEANYARTLEWQKENNLIKEWFYEPQTFWFDRIQRGVVSYKPDFKIINLDGTHHWIEVKGYLDPRSRTKIRRFGIYFPEENLYVIGREWFNKNSIKWRKLIKDWE